MSREAPMASDHRSTRSVGVRIRRTAARIREEAAMAFWSAIARGRIKLAGGRCGRGLRVRGWIDLHISPGCSFTIGENVRVNSGYQNNAVGGFRRAGFWVGPKGSLVISNNAGLSNCTIVAMNSVEIGEHVLVGGDA